MHAKRTLLACGYLLPRLLYRSDVGKSKLLIQHRMFCKFNLFILVSESEQLRKYKFLVVIPRILTRPKSQLRPTRIIPSHCCSATVLLLLHGAVMIPTEICAARKGSTIFYLRLLLLTSTTPQLIPAPQQTPAQTPLVSHPQPTKTTIQQHPQSSSGFY